MKKTNRVSAILMAVLVLLGLVVSAGKIFAENIYEIVYSGGQELSEDNVRLETSLTNLVALYTEANSTVTYSDSEKWEPVYYDPDGAGYKMMKMIRAWDNNRITQSDDIWFMLSNSEYDVKVQINGIALEGLGDLSENGNNVSVGGTTWLYAGYAGDHPYMPLFTDRDHTQPVERLVTPLASDGQRIFVDTTITLYKHGTTQLFMSDDLYFGITDIDAAQSYKMINATMTDNLYAMDASALNTVDPANNPEGLRNMFVADKNYIYSEYTSTGGSFNLPNVNNIFLKTSVATQTEGLNVIFGFATSAGSSLLYYAPQYTVTYDSDANGKITDITSETMFSGNNPAGSSSSPITGYEFKRWIADKDVTLNNGTTIAAGQPLTSAQVRTVKVTSDINFTAIHETRKLTVDYTSDRNGRITGIARESVDYNSNPTGTIDTPNEGFVLDHWIADVDVVLTNGDTIDAGEPITDEEVEQVVVTEHIEFTAIHRDARLNVIYESDENGEITGVTDEVVMPGETPEGSESTPADGYEFLYWIADKTVTLEDGSEIQAGGPITPEQLLQIVVEEDLVFTAIHRTIPVPDAPNTGLFANGMFGDSGFVIPVLGLSVIAALVKIIPMLFRKKIKF